MLNRALKVAAAQVVGAVVATATAYRQARDFFAARKEQPFRG